MEVDYPAAHSMDSLWFAVDAAGHVSLFDTGENGQAPDSEITDIGGELWNLWRRDSLEDWDIDELCRTVGLYAFGYPEEFDPIAPYIRYYVPEIPLHIDQLPPNLRERCGEVRFDVSFDQLERIQPLEFLPCAYWYEDRVAYVCGDGQTVRPIPGKEAEFAAFVREFSERDPNEASKMIFDGPTQ